MNELLFFCCAVLFSSAVFGAITFALSFVNRRYQHWPMLWATSIIVIVFTSVLATLFFALPGLNPSDSLYLGALHPALGPVEVVAWTGGHNTESQQQGWPSTTALLSMLYFVGTTLFLLRLINGRIRASRIAGAARKATSARACAYWLTPQPVSPFVIRLFRGDSRFKIVLPESLVSRLSEREIDHILQHELAHIKRRDDEYGLVLRSLVALTWFTPVTHLLFQRWAESIEVLCDQEVVQDSPSESRKIYAKTLLKTLQLSTLPGRKSEIHQYPVASFNSTQLRNEKSRIEKILLGYPNSINGLVHRLATVLVAAGLSLASAVAFSANADIACLQKQTSTTPENHFRLAGRITSIYGRSADPFTRGAQRDHKGVDIAAPLGTPIHAPQDAIIVTATDLYDEKPNYGKVVVIQTEGGVHTLLAHLHSYTVRTGQRVRAGAVIASVGSTGASTGPHVHIETRLLDERVDPFSIWNLSN